MTLSQMNDSATSSQEQCSPDLTEYEGILLQMLCWKGGVFAIAKSRVERGHEYNGVPHERLSYLVARAMLSGEG